MSGLPVSASVHGERPRFVEAVAYLYGTPREGAGRWTCLPAVSSVDGAATHALSSREVAGR